MVVSANRGLRNKHAPRALHVFMILLVRAREQVRRVAADWVIAQMSYQHAVWNWTKIKLPSKPVSL